jgi:hypothetical protein
MISKQTEEAPMFKTPIVKDVVITLSPDQADTSRSRLTVTSEGETLYTRSTKFDADYVGRVERYMREAKVYRDTAYEVQGDALVARGRFTTYG